MDINICSLKMLKYLINNHQIDFSKNVCVIASTSFSNNVDFLQADNEFDDVLILLYDDTEKMGANSFTEDLAQHVKDFVDRLDNNCILYICCDEGVSRSSAIACAIKRYLGQNEMDIWNNPHYNPNIFVYDILCNIFGFINSEEELLKLREISKNALHKAINGID